jgi:hypothetical protein
MYSLTEILTGAALTAANWTKNGASAHITPGNQLIGTYTELLRFVAANAVYKGWEVHHILEAVDIDRLNLTALAPAYEQQICVLLPALAHQRINSVLRRSNPTSMTATVADLTTAYQAAYAILGNYCGSSEAVIKAELLALFKASLKNLTDAALAALAAELARKRGDLQKLQAAIARQKGLHAALLLGSTPHTSEGFTAALVSTVGAVVNKLNPINRPSLDIWAKAEAKSAAAAKAIAVRDLSTTIAALVECEGHFVRADALFSAWRDGIEVAGRRAQLAVVGSAVVAAVAAFVVLQAPATAAVGASTAAGATTNPAAQQTMSRIAASFDAGFKRIALATTLAEEQAGEAAVEQAAVQLKRMVLPSF